MAAEPGDEVEHVATAVVDEKDPRGRIAGEEGLLEFLGEELGAGDGDCLEFLAGADVDEARRRS